MEEGLEKDDQQSRMEKGEQPEDSQRQEQEQEEERKTKNYHDPTQVRASKTKSVAESIELEMYPV